MRIRTIKPEFWTHPILAALDDGARLMAIGLLNLADDEGYFIAHPTLVRNALRPFDEDSSRTRRALEKLTEIGWIEVREHSEQGQIGKVVNFTKHQRIDRPTPSKLSTYFDSTSPRRALDEPSLLERKGKEGKGKEQEMDMEHSSKQCLEHASSNSSQKSEKQMLAESASKIIEQLNGLTGRDFRAVDSNISLIVGRLKEPGVTVDGCLEMIQRQCRLWMGDPEMERYLRPETLFRKSKFDGYYASRSIPLPSGRAGFQTENPEHPLNRDWSKGPPQYKLGTEFPETQNQ